MFTIPFLLTISSYFLYDAAHGSRYLATGEFLHDHSGKEDNLHLSTIIISKLSSTSYSRDNGWTVYTTIKPEPSHNPFGAINDAINGNNKTIQFSKRTSSTDDRNTIPRIEGSRSYNTTSQFAPSERQVNYPFIYQGTNANNTISQIFKRMPSMYDSDAIPRRENLRRNNLSPLYTMDRLAFLSNSNIQEDGASIANRSNQLIRRMDPMYDSSAISRRGNSRMLSPVSRYTAGRLEPSADLVKLINDVFSENNKTNGVKNIPSIYEGSSIPNSEDSRMYNSWNILGINSKRENSIQKESTSTERCILSPGDKKRRCLKKVKRKKLKSHLRSNVLSEKNSTSFFTGRENRVKLHDTDAVVLKNGLNGRQKLGDEIKNSFKQQEGKTGIDDSFLLNQYAASDIPCTCHWNSQNCGCDCEGSLNYDNFMNLSQLFRPCQNFTFSMKDGHFYALPPNLFYKLNSVDNFHIYVTNSSFEYLLDPTPMTSAFTGVHFHHHAVVKLNKVTVRRGWNWSPFQKLQGAPGARVHVVVEDSALKRLTSDFSSFANGQVESIDVADSNLEMIGSAAFVTFVNMTNFRVPNNKISYLHRMDFPKMCLKLEEIDLRLLVTDSNLEMIGIAAFVTFVNMTNFRVPNNKISYLHRMDFTKKCLKFEEIDLRNNQLYNLEDGLFVAMPALKEIKLAGNPLRMLSEKTFEEIITRVNLRGISGIPLVCDCNLQWLKDSKMSGNGIIKENMDGATCRRPGHLRGTPFNSLSKEHLVCQ